MSEFTRPLLLEYIDGRNWRIISEFDFASEVAERLIKIPSGFITDFASVPRFFWRVLPPTGTYGKAAVIHDYLYRYCTVSKNLADLVFLEGMEVLQVPRYKRYIMYQAVNWFGKPSCSNGNH